MSFVPVINTVETQKPTDTPKFGEVVANNDPLKIGRVKVRIPGTFDGDVEQLPWVRRKQDTTFCGLDCEFFDVPDIGSIVEVKWNYNDNVPFYSGAPSSTSHISSTFKGNYPYEGGIKFGDIIIKFDKGSNNLTVENGQVQILLDGMGGCSVAADTIDLIASTEIRLQAPTTTVDGDLKVSGDFSCTNGASGMLNQISIGTVQNGIITGIQS